MKSTYSLKARCTPEQIWYWLEGTENQKQWLDGLVDSESVGPTPVGPGSRFHITMKHKQETGQAEVEITVYKKNERVMIKFVPVELRHVAFMLIDCRLAVRDGRTHFSSDLQFPDPEEGEKVGLLARLLARIAMIVMKRILRKRMRLIVRLAEQRAAETEGGNVR